MAGVTGLHDDTDFVARVRRKGIDPSLLSFVEQQIETSNPALGSDADLGNATDAAELSTAPRGGESDPAQSSTAAPSAPVTPTTHVKEPAKPSRVALGWDTDLHANPAWLIALFASPVKAVSVDVSTSHPLASDYDYSEDMADVFQWPTIMMILTLLVLGVSMQHFLFSDLRPIVILKTGMQTVVRSLRVVLRIALNLCDRYLGDALPPPDCPY